MGAKLNVGIAIFKILTDDAAVSAAVVSDGISRIFPNVARTNTDFPFIIYQVTGETPTQYKDAPSTLDTDSIMVSVYHDNYAKATELAGQVRNALDRTSGSYTASGTTVNIQSIKYDGYSDIFNDNQTGTGVYRIALDFDVRIIRA